MGAAYNYGCASKLCKAYIKKLRTSLVHGVAGLQMMSQQRLVSQVEGKQMGALIYPPTQTA